MSYKAVKGVAKFIVSFLVERTGNDAFNRYAERKKIIRVLKQDQKNIKEIFCDLEGTEIALLIEQFIMYHVFKKKEFYADDNLSPEQEEQLWVMFVDYIKKQNRYDYVNSSYRERIIRCVNLHNDDVKEIILDEDTKIHMKWQQEQNEMMRKSIHDIVDTLSIETQLQEEDGNLEFITVQLESIMKSYRFDINQLRRHQMVCIYGALVFLGLSTIFMPTTLESAQNNFGMFIVAILFAIVVVSVIGFGINNFKKLSRIELDMAEARESLWRIHFYFYRCMLKSKLSEVIDSAPVESKEESSDYK